LIKPDAVIHAAAASKPDFCQENPEVSRKINVDSVISISGLCSDLHIPFVFTSSDLVFNGINPPYSEEDPPSPVSIYGEQKLEAENAALCRYPDTAVCRMPLMFGDTSSCAQSILQPVLTSLCNKKTVKLFTDEYRSPVSAYTATQGILMAITAFKGIIHLGGRTRISRYNLGIQIAQYCGLDTACIRPVFQKDATVLAPRPPDVTLSSSKAFKQGYNPLPLPEELGRVLSLRSYLIKKNIIDNS